VSLDAFEHHCAENVGPGVHHRATRRRTCFGPVGPTARTHDNDGSVPSLRSHGMRRNKSYRAISAERCGLTDQPFAGEGAANGSAVRQSAKTETARPGRLRRRGQPRAGIRPRSQPRRARSPVRTAIPGIKVNSGWMHGGAPRRIGGTQGAKRNQPAARRRPQPNFLAANSVEVCR